MSGHNKWASIKHKKGAMDAKRAKLFTKIIRELTVAAKLGGGEPEMNARLRTAITKAKDSNMPSDNIERAIKRGTGELEGVNYEERLYEGYGPEGVALMLDTLTDNTNRTTAEIRKILSKAGGNLGEQGCVAYLFETKGVIYIPKSEYKEDALFEIALDVGADDMQASEEQFIIYTSMEDYIKVRDKLEKKKINIESSGLERIAKTTIPLSMKKAEKILHLIETLEELDDIQAVYSNVEISE